MTLLIPTRGCSADPPQGPPLSSSHPHSDRSPQCRPSDRLSPTVTDQMAHYVAPVAFGSTWTIMMIVAFRTQRLGPAVIFILPVPCQRKALPEFASYVRLLLVRLFLWKDFQLPLVLSLAFGNSADLFVHTFLKLHYWTLTLEVSQTSTLITGVSSLIPSSSRIPTLPGAAATQYCACLIKMLIVEYGTGSSVGITEGSTEARCSSSSSSSSSFLTLSSSLSSSDDSLS
ncbi:hypothetical protein Tco_0432571 [Tanacetum coccineum]